MEIWRPLVQQYFGTHTDDALKIMECESQGDPNRVGDENLTYWKNGIEYGKSYNLFQYRHLPTRPPLTDPVYHDPETNIKYASMIFKAQHNRFGTRGGWYNCAKIMGVD